MTTGHGSFAPTAWWGYDHHETVFKPTEELSQKLIDIVSKGGNFLLNVGPEPTGKIRPEETERLLGVGRWMDRYSDAIYGTTASPFRLLPFFGRVTGKGNTLYVHVFDWPEDERLLLPGLKSKVKRAYVMGKPDVGLDSEREPGTSDVVLHLPDKAADPLASVLVLEFDGPIEAEPVQIAPDDDGIINLPAHYAEIQAHHGQRAKPVSEGGRTYIGNWSNPNDVVVWQFTLPSAGTYTVQIEARKASDDALGQQVEVGVGDQKAVGKIEANDVKMDGQLKLQTGEQSISVKLPNAKRTGPPVLDLFGLNLVPVQP